MIDYRYLGGSALKISPLVLGTMMFGGETDETTAHRIIDKASERGINIIDTSDSYNAGRSEEVTGRGIKAKRERWVLATKFANPAADRGPNLGGYSRKWVVETVERSLRRLGTDYIDILYIHKPIIDAPLSEPLRAIGDLIRQGKLRYFGISNFRAWRIGEVVHLADQIGMDRPVANQPLYNIVNRTAEAEQLPASAAYGVGVIAYSPLARGVLTGKYDPNRPPAPDSRAGRSDKRIMETEWRPESLKVAEHIRRHAEERGMSAADFSLSWVLNNRLVTAAIAGPRTEAHWDGYMKALDIRLTSEDEDLVNSLVPAGHVSTHGYTDPSYPVEGRLPF